MKPACLASRLYRYVRPEIDPFGEEHRKACDIWYSVCCPLAKRDEAMERRVHQELYCHKGLNKQTIQRLEKCTPASAQYKFREAKQSSSP